MSPPTRNDLKDLKVLKTRQHDKMDNKETAPAVPADIQGTFSAHPYGTKRDGNSPPDNLLSPKHARLLPPRDRQVSTPASLTAAEPSSEPKLSLATKRYASATAASRLRRTVKKDDGVTARAGLRRQSSLPVGKTTEQREKRVTTGILGNIREEDVDKEAVQSKDEAMAALEGIEGIASQENTDITHEEDCITTLQDASGIKTPNDANTLLDEVPKTSTPKKNIRIHSDEVSTTTISNANPTTPTKPIDPPSSTPQNPIPLYSPRSASTPRKTPSRLSIEEAAFLRKRIAIDATVAAQERTWGLEAFNFASQFPNLELMEDAHFSFQMADIEMKEGAFKEDWWVRRFELFKALGVKSWASDSSEESELTGTSDEYESDDDEHGQNRNDIAEEVLNGGISAYWLKEMHKDAKKKVDPWLAKIVM